MSSLLAKPWLFLALDSQRTANLLRESSHHRASSSRYYYAAYQVSTALLHYVAQEPPTVAGQKRESWNHDVTPDMLADNLSPYIRSCKVRNGLRSNLRELYKIRVQAGYDSSGTVNEDVANNARKLANYIVKVVLETLPTNWKDKYLAETFSNGNK